MAKSTKWKTGMFAIQINAPLYANLVKIISISSNGGVYHTHMGSKYPRVLSGVIHEKYLRRPTKKELLLHAVREEY